MKRKAPASNAPIAKRVKRLERVARASRPEMKTATFSINTTVPALAAGVKGFIASDITTITQGDTINQRSGNRVKLWRVEVRGITAVTLDGYLLQKHVPDLPVEADLVNDSFAPYLIESANNIRYTEWAHVQGLYTDADKLTRFKVVRNFKGMEVKYAGSTSTPSENGVCLVFSNSSTGTGYINCSIRIWFTDP